MSKRGENIYKRKDGRWEARLKKQNGKYIYIYGNTYTEAKEKRNERIKSYEEKQIVFEQKIIEQLEQWLNESYHRVKLSTYENYYYCMKTYIYPYFERSRTKSFSKTELESFVSHISNNTTLSYSYQKKILTIFKVALRSIFKDSEYQNSLLDSLKMPKAQKKMVEVFSIYEQQKIENELINNINVKTLGILICFYTGLRLGELGALKWSNIDLIAKTISITGTLSRKKNFEEGTNKTILYVSSPKNNSSIRQIPLSDFLVDLLKVYKAKDECFLLSSASIPMDPRTFQKYYKKMIIKAGVEYRKFHTVRHTFATRALEMGVDIKTVSELLGHASVTNTLNIYAHSLMEQKKRAVAKLNSMHISQMSTCAVNRF